MTERQMLSFIANEEYEKSNGRDFYEDLLETFELEDDRKSKEMYSLAYRNGSEYGYLEIFYHFRDLLEVLKK